MRCIFFSLALSFSITVFGQEKFDRRFDLSWETIPGASKYEVELFEVRLGEKVSLGVFETPYPSWSKTIRPGKYLTRLRALDHRGVPGAWSEESELKVKLGNVQILKPFQGEAVSTDDLMIQWAQLPGALRYQVFVRDLEGKIVFEETTPELESKALITDLTDYHLTVIPLMEGESEVTPEDLKDADWRKFERVGGELRAPVVQVKVDDRVILDWDKISEAAEYELVYLPPPKTKGESKKFITDKNSFTFSLGQIPDGVSTIFVLSRAPRFKDSKRTQVKVVRENAKVYSTVKTGDSPDLIGWGDQFRRQWGQIALLYGNGLYSSQNTTTDTTVKETPLGALGFQLDYHYTRHLAALTHTYQLEYYNYATSGISATTWNANYALTKSWRARGREWGAGAGAGLRSFPIILGDRFKNSFTVTDNLFVTPHALGWWQDSLNLRNTIKLDLTVFANVPLGSEADAKTSMFLSPRARFSWLYFLSTDQTLLMGLSYQVMKLDFTRSTGVSDNQELTLFGVHAGWGKSF